MPGTKGANMPGIQRANTPRILEVYIMVYMG